MRSTDLKKKRDRRLVEKFYELYDIKRMRMDDVLTELSENYFFIKPEYIYNIIFYNEENTEYYNKLISNN